MALSPARLDDLEVTLRELCALAAAETLPRFRAGTAVDDKGDGAFDPVTAADRGAEAAIRRALAARHPGHGVIGEEQGSDRADAEFVWVIDPVDGTRAFIAGLPLWTTLIGLRVAGATVLGAIAQPYLGETYIGGTGRPTRLIDRAGERTLRVRPCAALAGATIATTDPALFTGIERAGWDRLAAASRVARLGCDGYAMAMVAAGTIDLVAESGLKCWDVEGPRAVVEGAGGFVTDWTGAPAGPDGGAVLFAGDARILAQARTLLG